MRFAIYGAGAIGAYLGAKLAVAGEEVALIARGPHLRAMQTLGVRVSSPDGDFEAHPFATDDPSAVGEVDYVVLAVKAHGVTAVAPLLGPLLGEHTAVVTAQNGVPLVVLPTTRWALGGHAAGERRSWRRNRGAHRC